MNESLYNALEDSLNDIRTGKSLEECLEQYPEQVGELQPALESVQIVLSLQETNVPNIVLHRSRARILGKAAQLRNRYSRPFLSKLLHARFPRIVFIAFTLALLVFLSWEGLVGASAQSLPGDSLYPVKRVAEGINLHLALNTEVKQEMESSYRQRRLVEAEDLLELGRNQKVSLEGTITKMSGNIWIIDTISVEITPKTILVGDLQVDRLVELEGETRSEGFVIADEIHLRHFQFNGIVDSITPAKWTISGTDFVILSTTQIDPVLHVGDHVLVLVYSNDDGTLTANAIVRLPDEITIPAREQEDGESGNTYQRTEESKIIVGLLVDIRDGDDRIINSNEDSNVNDVHKITAKSSEEQIRNNPACTTVESEDEPKHNTEKVEDALRDKNEQDRRNQYTHDNHEDPEHNH